MQLIPIDREIDGMTPGITWVEHTQTGQLYVFKPDTDKQEHEVELEVHRKFSPWGFDLVLPIKHEFHGKVGILTKDFKTDIRAKYVDGFQLNTAFSLIDITNFEPTELTRKLVQIMQLDSLIQNSDRHPGNIVFKLNRENIPIDVAPIFDNVVSLHFSKSRNSLFGIDNKKVWTHEANMDFIREHPILKTFLREPDPWSDSTNFQ